jgi:UDP-2,3-diacylglucosamine hydrolase
MLPDEDSAQREKDFVQWLDKIKTDAQIIFLLGDIFDFWFEYRYVIPRGFSHLFGKLKDLTEAGIEIHFFTGNHDLWVLDYLSIETGVIMHRKITGFEINNLSFLLGHGHNTGPVSFGEKTLANMFKNKFLRKLFACIHPYWAISFGINWSKRNRAKHGIYEKFDGIEKEEIAIYCLEQLNQKHYDFFIFGHRHLAMDIRLNENSRYINTGEWMKSYTYAVFDGKNVYLRSFKKESDIIVIP